MQYKMFSGDAEFLPRRPEGLIDTLAKMTQFSVDFAVPKSLSVINGQDELLKELDIDNSTSSANKLNKDQLQTLMNMQQLMPHFEKLSISANKQLDARMNQEAESGYLTPQMITVIQHNAVNSFRSIQQNEMTKASNNECGFIMWLKIGKDLPPIEELNPDLIDPSLCILELIEEERKKKEIIQLKKNKKNNNNNDVSKEVDEPNFGVIEETECEIEDDVLLEEMSNSLNKIDEVNF